MIWTKVRSYVAKEKIKFWFADMKGLFYETWNKVTEENWKNCILLVIDKVRNKFWELDHIIESIIESFIINLNDRNSSLELNMELKS